MAVPLSAKALSALIGSIYDCALEPQRWPDTLTLIRRELGFCSASLSLIALPSGIPLLMLSSGIEPRWSNSLAPYLGDIVENWGGHDVLNRLPLDEPHVRSWVNPTADWKNTRYYREWAEPQQLIDMMAIPLTRDAASMGGVVCGRRRDQGPIGRGEVEAAALLLPHLQRAVAISRLLDVKSVVAAGLEATLETLAAAVMLVDAHRHVVHANRAARSMLTKGDPVAGRQGALILSSAAATTALGVALAQAAENETAIGRRGFGIPAPRADGSPCVLHVLPLQYGSLRPGLMPSAVAAVFVAPAVAPLPAPDDTLAALFDLTPAEARVLGKLAEGLTPPETAEELGIATNTVKTHLARIFSKTGTKRQAELISLAASLSMPA